MSDKLKPYPNTNFICDSCQAEFEQETVYSPAPNLSQLDSYHTYCVNCVEPTKKTKSKSKKSKKNWGVAPINETTENLQSLEVDKRTLKKTGRTVLFGTRVKQE